MSYASLRRHAAAPVLVAVLTIAPIGLTAVAAQAAPAPTTAAASTAVAPATTSVAKTAVAPATKKKLSKKAKHKLALKKAAAKRKAKAKAIAHSLVENKYKWSHRQWTCLKKLWARESGWRVKANNPSSSAYGIPQALPGKKMGKGWKSSARTQVKWGLKYIDGRYNTPCAANSHQHRSGWY